METMLPNITHLLAVCAHPDEESFGLGEVLSTFVATGTALTLLCFTRGEASTLGIDAEDLATRRTQELAAAAAILGIKYVTLLDYPDSGLGRVPLEDLAARVEEVAMEADAFLVFDAGGITGRPDHERARPEPAGVRMGTAAPGRVQAQRGVRGGVRRSGGECARLSVRCRPQSAARGNCLPS